MTVKVGIWGAGFMGRTHGRILKTDPRVELISVFDSDPEAAQQAALELDCRSAGSSQELLEGIEAVYLTLPNTLHAEAALQALLAGRHIFCEKPFATSARDGRRVLEAWRRGSTIFQVGHNRRFAPAYRRIRTFLEGQPEPPSLVHLKMNRGELESPAWVGNTGLTGGYLYETPLHILDLAAWLFGELEILHLVSQQRRYGEPDSFGLLLSTASGLPLTFNSCAHATWAFPYERLEIFGPYYTVESAECDQVTITQRLREPSQVERFHSLPFEEKLGYRGIDRNFIGAVLGEEETAVTPEDGFRVVELVEGCYRLAAIHPTAG